MPKVSVIIPAYNAALTIRETVNCVQQQTIKNIEIIVIDDGSSDNTVEIVQNIAESRLKIFSYQNAGVSSARNRGIAHAQGEYITFLDADDLWSLDKLELQLRVLKNNFGAAVAYSWTKFIDCQGKFLYSGISPHHQGNVFQALLQKNFLLSGSNILISRETLQFNSGFDPELSYSADWDFALRLAAKFNFVNVSKYQIFYRQSPDSMSSKIEEMKQESFLTIDKALKTAPTELQHIKNKSYSVIYLYCADFYLQKGNKNLNSTKDNLQQALLLNPKIIFSVRTQRILTKLIRLRLSQNIVFNFIIHLWYKLKNKYMCKGI